MTTPHGATGWWLVNLRGSLRAMPMSDEGEILDGHSIVSWTYDPAEVLAWLNGASAPHGADPKPTPALDDEGRRLLEEAVDYVHFAHNEGEGNAADLERRIWAHLERTPGLLGGERPAVEGKG